MTQMEPRPLIPLTGILCKGKYVSLAWPEEEVFDAITALRNRSRAAFFDSTIIDRQKNRAWLGDLSTRPQQATLAVRWTETGTFLGTIGWSKWDPSKRTAQFGRIVFDPIRCIATKPWAAGYAGPTIDAGLTLGAFGFAAMALDRVESQVYEDNILSRRLALACGMIECHETTTRRSAGRGVTTFVLTRAEWLALQRHSSGD